MFIPFVFGTFHGLHAVWINLDDVHLGKIQSAAIAAEVCAIHAQAAFGDVFGHFTPPIPRRNPSLPVGRFHPIHHVLSFHFLTFSKISSRVGAPDKAVSWCSIFSCSFLLGRQRRICSAQQAGQRKLSTALVGGQQGQLSTAAQQTRQHLRQLMRVYLLL